MTNKRIDNYSIMITSKYFNSIEDFINLEVAVKRFEGNMERFHFNPIPLNDKTRSFFPNLETFHLFNENDHVFDDGRIFKHCIWYCVGYHRYLNEKRKGNDCKDVFYTGPVSSETVIPEGITKFGAKQIFSVQNLTIPNSINRINETSIKMQLTSLSIPYVLTTVDSHIFFGQGILHSIETPSLKILNGSPFVFNSKDHFEVPEDYFELNNHCFYCCKSLTNIIIPTSIDSLPNYCFGNCLNLRTISIPSTVTNLGSSCFSYCEQISEIVIPQGVTKIPSGCFLGCQRLTNIIIPDSVCLFKNRSFMSCSSLTSIHIPTLLTQFCSESFYNCLSLKELNFSHHVQLISRNCLDPIVYLTSLSMPDVIMASKEKVFYTEGEVLNSLKLSFSIISVNGKVINEPKIVSFDIPSTIRTIGVSCFKNCEALSSLNIPNKVCFLCQNCFMNCSSLTSIHLSPYIRHLPQNCFRGCVNIPELELPRCLTSIGTNCFHFCSSLKHIEIPDKVSFLSDYCFSQCYSLTQIHFPTSLKTIKPYCFEGSRSLNIPLFPSNVTIKFGFMESHDLKISITLRTKIFLYCNAKASFFNVKNGKYILAEEELD